MSYVQSHPAGWLFADKRPFWDTTRPDLPYADCNWRSTTTTDASVGKEPTMATKNTAAKSTAKTTANAKENTMSNETKTSYNDRSAAKVADRAKLQETILAKVKEPSIPEVTHILPGKTAANLCDDPAEIELLRYAAAYYGWDDVAYCTAAQAKKFGGTVKDGAQGFDLLWKPKTTKTGKNAGVTTQHVATVYPASAFEWANGAPNDHDYKVAKAQRALRKAERELKAAERDGKPKPKTKAEMQAENDDLREQMAKMQEQMAQLLAKLA